jgi:hypothetical protein
LRKSSEPPDQVCWGFLARENQKSMLDALTGRRALLGVQL